MLGRVEAGRNGGNRGDSNEVAVVVGIEVGLNVSGVLLDVYVDIARFEHFIGNQQIAGFDNLKGVSLGFKDWDDAILKQLSVRSLRFGIADETICHGDRADAQNKCESQKDRYERFHMSSPFEMNCKCMFHPADAGHVPSAGGETVTGACAGAR